MNQKALVRAQVTIAVTRTMTKVLSRSIPAQRNLFLTRSVLGANDRKRPYRLLGLDLPPLARALLPGEAPPAPLVRSLCGDVPHRRAQHQLLPSAQAGDLHQMARSVAGGLPLRGQGPAL